MNEVANVCEAFGANVDEVRKAIGSDRRIGSSFLFPGVGYGGSCFPKDVKAILKFAADKGYEFEILRAVEASTSGRRAGWSPRWRRTSAICPGKTIALWGLAFKPRTDDMREAPAITIVERLLASGREGAGVRSRGDAASRAGSSGRRFSWPRRATTR